MFQTTNQLKIPWHTGNFQGNPKRLARTSTEISQGLGCFTTRAKALRIGMWNPWQLIPSLQLFIVVAQNKRSLQAERITLWQTDMAKKKMANYSLVDLSNKHSDFPYVKNYQRVCTVTRTSVLLQSISPRSNLLLPLLRSCLEPEQLGGSISLVISQSYGKPPCISGWWLGHPSEKYEFVNWDD